jgi:hypothetical protein
MRDQLVLTNFVRDMQPRAQSRGVWDRAIRRICSTRMVLLLHCSAERTREPEDISRTTPHQKAAFRNAEAQALEVSLHCSRSTVFTCLQVCLLAGLSLYQEMLQSCIE